MEEVLNAAVVAHLDVYAKHVAFPPDLFDGLPWSERDLRTARTRIDWDPYAELLDRLGALVGSDEGNEVVGAHMDQTAPWVNLLLSSVLSPIQAIKFWERMVPHAWRCMAVSVTALGEDRVDLRSWIKPGYRGCRTMFVASRGAVATMTCRVGLPAALLEHDEVSAHHGHYRLLLPRSRTVPARVRGRFEGVWALLGSDRVDVDRAMSWVQTTNARMEGYVALLERVGQVGRAVAGAATVDEVARLTCAAVIEDCGYSGARFSVVPRDGGEPVSILHRDAPPRPADATWPLERGARRLGLLEAWGTPRHADLVTSLLPWLTNTLDARRELAEHRELAARAAREREALATILQDRPTWILDARGAVEWSNAAGRAELAEDPRLADRLRGPLEPTEFDLQVSADGSHRVVQRRTDRAEVERRAERAARQWGLTPAQRRVLEHVVRGLTNQDAAQALSVREATVEAHLGQVFRKSGAESRAALVFGFWTL